MPLGSGKLWLRRTLLFALALLPLLAITGACYQMIASRLDARRFHHAGQLVSAGRFRLNVYCIGQGSPTVVLEAGLADSLDSWSRVQPEIAQFSRVCSYDRAGYGYSDPGPMPRTSDRIASELHAALQSAGEKPPYVLVGIRSAVTASGSSMESTRTKLQDSFWSTPRKRISAASSRGLGLIVAQRCDGVLSVRRSGLHSTSAWDSLVFSRGWRAAKCRP